MKIELTSDESEMYFYNSLCNALGYVESYGIELIYIKEEFIAAKIKLQIDKPGEAICYEDVLMEILRQGGTLKMVDNEDEDELLSSITLAEVHTRVSNTPIKHLMDAINENDDADTADVIIQTVFFNEIVYG